MAKVVDHLGNEFNSIKDMCKHYGISNSLYTHRLQRGYTPQEALEGRFKVTDSGGKYFKSLKEMCDYHAISVSAYRKRIKKGVSDEELFSKDKTAKTGIKVQDHLGNQYTSILEMCKAYSINRCTYIQRRNKGMSLKDALTLPVEATACKSRLTKDHLGNKYSSKKEMCKAYNIDYATYIQRRKRGISLKDALTLPINRVNTINITDHLGNKYPSYRAMAETYLVPTPTLLTRLRRGWAIEDALGTKQKYIIRDCLGNEFKTAKNMCEHYKIPYNNVFIQRRSKSKKSIEEAVYMPYKKHIMNLSFDIADFFMNGDMPYYCCTCEKCGYKGVLGLKEMIDHKCEKDL